RRVRADRLDALHSIHQSPAGAGLHAADDGDAEIKCGKDSAHPADAADRVGELAELGIAVARTAAGPVAARKAGTTRTDCGIVSGNCAAARAVSRNLSLHRDFQQEPGKSSGRFIAAPDVTGLAGGRTADGRGAFNQTGQCRMRWLVWKQTADAHNPAFNLKSSPAHPPLRGRSARGDKSRRRT